MSNSCINDFNRTVRTYYKELKKYKPLDRESEKRLLKRAKENNIEAKNDLIISNLKFVFNIAKMYKGKGASIDDLISEGNLGLVKAIDKFDTSKDVRFLSYAIWWIRHSMSEYVEKKSSISNNEMSLDGNDKSVGDNLYDEYNDDSDDVINNIEDVKEEEKYDDFQQRRINKIILKLDERSKFIIKSYFGFGKKSMSLEEIGKELCLSRERVRKIKEKSLRIIRSELMMSNEFSDFFNI